jgi:hypothetical protein
MRCNYSLILFLAKNDYEFQISFNICKIVAKIILNFMLKVVSVNEREIISYYMKKFYFL